ncbi:hypothetical protein BCE75_11236 [Isoptericola sp. CG 20/1183]|uniref:Excreted virulence factor EspC (Type VII ESX diderm) n=1 Tax=Isoptericola halotolerans TaxID=300560 RepID=A0ABX5EAK3_9MICO|nr:MULTISPECIES: hypothetical protein [Isoptericola]PRZ03817.1 hypothetical protein BCE75_11236 [Isoptericola sp. CG 20/1183]PRZ04050.1 hypothetical protein BCL65_11184 [Isoptericola halotolerans]
MSDLRMDVAAVTELGESLTTVADEFENANTRSDGLAESVGHDGLAEAVRSFAHNWDDKRAKMTENLVALADAASTVATTFTDADSELARALEEGGE